MVTVSFYTPWPREAGQTLEMENRGLIAAWTRSCRRLQRMWVITQHRSTGWRHLGAGCTARPTNGNPPYQLDRRRRSNQKYDRRRKEHWRP